MCGTEDDETKFLLSQSDSIMTTGLKIVPIHYRLALASSLDRSLYLPVLSSSDSFSHIHAECLKRVQKSALLFSRNATISGLNSVLSDEISHNIRSFLGSIQ